MATVTWPELLWGVFAPPGFVLCCICPGMERVLLLWVLRVSVLRACVSTRAFSASRVPVVSAGPWSCVLPGRGSEGTKVCRCFVLRSLCCSSCCCLEQTCRAQVSRMGPLLFTAPSSGGCWSSEVSRAVLHDRHLCITRFKQTLQRHERGLLLESVKLIVFRILQQGLFYSKSWPPFLCCCVDSPFPQGPMVTGALPAAVQGHHG